MKDLIISRTLAASRVYQYFFSLLLEHTRYEAVFCCIIPEVQISGVRPDSASLYSGTAVRLVYEY